MKLPGVTSLYREVFRLDADDPEKEINMHSEVDELKERAIAAVDDVSDELTEISKKIFQNPELGFEEYRASGWLVEACQSWGFDVKTGLGGMGTSFVARFARDPSGPTLAFLSEYDALPDLGHGCGHNLIATIGLGVGYGLAEVMREYELPGTVRVIGTPAEEGGGGKIKLIEDGCFDDVDAAMMVHPADKTLVEQPSLAVRAVEFDFIGKSSHAAAEPELGINALDAAISTFNNLNAFREHMKDSAKIHGIITDGGEKPNIVPGHAGALFYVRALDADYLEELTARLEDCARAGAIAAGAELEVSYPGMNYMPMNPNPVLSDLFRDNLEWFDETMDEPSGGLGSLDMGNVSQVTPSIHPYIQIADPPTPGHSDEFVRAANSTRGYEQMITSAKLLATIGVDLLADGETMSRVRQAFEESKTSKGS